MKKTIVALLAVVMALSLLPGCGSKTAETQTEATEEHLKAVTIAANTIDKETTETQTEAAEEPLKAATETAETSDTENLAPDITTSEWGQYIIEQNPTMEITLQLQSKGNSQDDINDIYTLFECVRADYEDNPDLDLEVYAVRGLFDKDYSEEYLAWRRQFWEDPIQKTSQPQTNQSNQTNQESSTSIISSDSSTQKSNTTQQNQASKSSDDLEMHDPDYVPEDTFFGSSQGYLDNSEIHVDFDPDNMPDYFGRNTSNDSNN